MSKLAKFVNDFIFFIPKLKDDSGFDITPKDMKEYTVTEKFSYERIARILEVIDESQYRKLEKAQEFIVNHNCKQMRKETVESNIQSKKINESDAEN